MKAKCDLNSLTMDRYNSIVKYKTAYYSFVLPVQLAMYFVSIYRIECFFFAYDIKVTNCLFKAGVKDEELHRQAETILLEMGRFFQIQDDYIDCFGDPKVTGKKGTDIVEGKCSWIAVVALQKVNSAQRKIMEVCYELQSFQLHELHAFLYFRNVMVEMSLTKLLK